MNLNYNPWKIKCSSSLPSLSVYLSVCLSIRLSVSVFLNCPHNCKTERGGVGRCVGVGVGVEGGVGGEGLCVVEARVGNLAPTCNAQCNDVYVKETLLSGYRSVGRRPTIRGQRKQWTLPL